MTPLPRIGSTWQSAGSDPRKVIGLSTKPCCGVFVDWKNLVTRQQRSFKLATWNKWVRTYGAVELETSK